MSKSGVIVLDKPMVVSPVWLSLSGTAIKVYHLFRCKCQIAKKNSHRYGDRKGGNDLMGRLLNNGELEFTYIEAKDKYGITPSRFTRSIDELVEKGFLDVTNPGGGVHKMKTLYGISERWRAYDTPGFKKIGRPERRFKCGFRRGNDFWKRSKRKSQLSIMRTARALAMHKNAHGGILAMHNNAHGEKVKTQYNFNKGQRLCAQIA